MMNIFEKATKDKIMFDYKGQINCSDLWDLDVEELDSIYKTLNLKKKQMCEDSLLEKKTSEDTLLNTQINIIKHIVEYKLAEKEARLLFAERKARKEKIMEIIASKQDNALEKKSIAQLQKELDSL